MAKRTLRISIVAVSALLVAQTGVSAHPEGAESRRIPRIRIEVPDFDWDLRGSDHSDDGGSSELIMDLPRLRLDFDFDPIMDLPSLRLDGPTRGSEHADGFFDFSFEEHFNTPVRDSSHGSTGIFGPGGLGIEIEFPSGRLDTDLFIPPATGSLGASFEHFFVGEASRFGLINPRTGDGFFDFSFEEHFGVPERPSDHGLEGSQIVGIIELQRNSDHGLDAPLESHRESSDDVAGQITGRTHDGFFDFDFEEHFGQVLSFESELRALIDSLGPPQVDLRGVEGEGCRSGCEFSPTVAPAIDGSRGSSPYTHRVRTHAQDSTDGSYVTGSSAGHGTASSGFSDSRRGSGGDFGGGRRSR